MDVGDIANYIMIPGRWCLAWAARALSLPRRSSYMEHTATCCSSVTADRCHRLNIITEMGVIEVTSNFLSERNPSTP